MDIVIVADFCGMLDETANNRFLFIAKMLQQEHSVEIVTSDFCHAKKTYFEDLSGRFPFQVTMLHEAAYTKNISLRRFYAHYIWGKNVKRYLNTRKKPDVVFCAVPTLTAAKETAKYCKKNHIKYVVDVQDLWPEAFQMIFKVPVLSDIVFLPFKLIADSAYRQADEVCAVSQTYVNRVLAVNKRCKEGCCVFLGTKLEEFDMHAQRYANSEEHDDIWLAYCGSLGKSYDLECAIDAVSILNKQGYHNIKFWIMGDGALKEKFEAHAREKDVNAVFTGFMQYPQMCGMLASCDIAINPIVAGSAGTIINKHGDYAAAGIPVVNSQESQEYRTLIDTYGMGLNCINGDAADMAEKIKILIDNPELRKHMGNNARKCAEEKFDRKFTYQQIANKICQ